MCQVFALCLSSFLAGVDAISRFSFCRLHFNGGFDNLSHESKMAVFLKHFHKCFRKPCLGGGEAGLSVCRKLLLFLFELCTAFISFILLAVRPSFSSNNSCSSRP